ncbi:MAG: ABC transporter permease subunit [Neisseriales bacterium]|nr:MAG: ABC transporter permease subunit [Neisseriales bacterium]
MIRFQSLPRQIISYGGNRWDWALLPIVLAFLALLAWGASQMSAPYQVGTSLPILLDPIMLPYYLFRTMLRMCFAMIISLLFACVFAILATKIKLAERVLLPLLDILQSIPVLGFSFITLAGFIALFPGNLLGVECAAIFAIFTSQAWNMAFSLYQSLRTIPFDLAEAACVFRLSGWQRFWRLELPFAMPNLLWNMMMSMSGGWFFVVASEAISVSNQSIRLPGIGSYIALAIDMHNIHAILWAIVAMGLGILIYDQCIFRPLLAWADKFRFEETGGGNAQTSWLLSWLRRTNHFQKLGFIIGKSIVTTFSWFYRRELRPMPSMDVRTISPRWMHLFDFFMLMVVLLISWQLVHFILRTVHWVEISHVFALGCYTMIRVLVLIMIATLFWVPIGVWIGLNPNWSNRLQALAQFMAAFPANLMFPLMVIMIVRFQLNPNIWLSPLMILGTQWYLLFNVIAGASAIPTELRYAAKNTGLKGWLKWKRYLLPAIFPSFITGAITASGGSWNASIVAEYARWGDTTLKAEGLGSYIAHMTAVGDYPRLALGIGMMCLFVMSLNGFVWRKLYRISVERIRLS